MNGCPENTVSRPEMQPLILRTVQKDQAVQTVEDKPAGPTGWSSFLDPSVSSFEKTFDKMVMGKMLQDFEKAVGEQTKILDDIARQSEEERKKREKDKLTEHIPGPLKDGGRTLEEIWKLMDNLIAYANYDEEKDDRSLRKVHLKQIDDRAMTCLTAHAIGAWVSTLDKPHLDHIATRIISDTSLWISRIWRFKSTSSFFHDVSWDGVLGVCRLALVERYPKFPSEGFQALYSKPPVIYLSAAAEPGLAEYIRMHLGLPAMSVCLVPNNFAVGGDESVDVAAFEEMIAADLPVGKTPLLLLAYAGTRLTGTVDDLAKLATICKNHKIWLHVEGMKLSQLALLSVPMSVHGTNTRVDSMTLDLGAWLGIPVVPYNTQFRTTLEEPLLRDLGLTNAPITGKLSVFPLWVAMQTMGHDGIVERIKFANKLITQMEKLLKPISSIEILKRTPVRKKKNVNGVEEVEGISNLIGTILLHLISLDTPNPLITFRYVRDRQEKPSAPGKTKAPYAKGQSKLIKTPIFVDSEEERYYNALNQWLCETLQGAFPKIGLAPIQIDGIGTCIRFCPLETAQLRDTTAKDLDFFVKSLKHHLSILNATMSKRGEFREIASAQDQFLLVNLQDWAGLGAVIYIPQSCMGKPLTNLSHEDLEDMSAVNHELVSKLRSSDGAFSLCHIPPPWQVQARGDNISLEHEDEARGEELVCVRFGLITADTDIEELVGMVLATGLESEESCRYFERLSDMVKKGIEVANEDLAKEHQEKLMQEGALRQVPFLDSLVNWWSPPPKDVTKGRMFNLASGEVQSTEDTYKYKMQLSTTPIGQRPPSPTGSLSSLTGQRISHKGLLKPRLSKGSHDGPGQHERSGSLSSVSVDSVVGGTLALQQSIEEKPA